MDFLKIKNRKSGSVMSSGLIQSLFSTKNLVPEMYSFAKIPHPVSPRWAVFSDIVDFQKKKIRDTESFNKSRGHDKARFPIFVFLSVTPTALDLDLEADTRMPSCG